MVACRCTRCIGSYWKFGQHPISSLNTQSQGEGKACTSICSTHIPDTAIIARGKNISNGQLVLWCIWTCWWHQKQLTAWWSVYPLWLEYHVSSSQIWTLHMAGFWGSNGSRSKGDSSFHSSIRVICQSKYQLHNWRELGSVPSSLWCSQGAEHPNPRVRLKHNPLSQLFGLQ